MWSRELKCLYIMSCLSVLTGWNFLKMRRIHGGGNILQMEPTSRNWGIQDSLSNIRKATTMCNNRSRPLKRCGRVMLRGGFRRLCGKSCIKGYLLRPTFTTRMLSLTTVIFDATCVVLGMKTLLISFLSVSFALILAEFHRWLNISVSHSSYPFTHFLRHLDIFSPGKRKRISATL